jgi:hypothetical protein
VQVTPRGLVAASAIVCLLWSDAAAQGPAAPPASPTILETLGTWLEVRQNTSVKKDVAKPAFVTVTNPVDGPATYQIGLGVLADAYSGTLFDIDALFNYQRNTAIDTTQDLLEGGATADWQWRAMNGKTVRSSPLLAFKAEFSRDAVAKTRGFQAAVGYTHLFAGKSGMPRPNAPFRVGDAFEILYVPLVGLELDRVLDADTTEAEGMRTRALAQVSTALYPAPRRWRMKVEVLASYAWRKDIKDTTNETDDEHPLFTFEANWFPVKNDKVGDVGFGVSYVRGENPDEGFTHQRYWQLGLKFRLK